jgi:hypothetical protein
MPAKAKSGRLSSRANQFVTFGRQSVHSQNDVAGVRRSTGQLVLLGTSQAATGWLPHTTRAALTGLCKRGDRCRPHDVQQRMTLTSCALTGSLQDQLRDFLRLRDKGQVTRFYLYGLGSHALSHETLEIGVDRAVFR